MVMHQYAAATAAQRALMTLAVERLLREGGARCELVRSGPGEWRAEWLRPQPREQVVLATIYVEREAEARAALIAALWDGLHGAGRRDAAGHTERHQ